jgi:hypothetical protein
VTQRRDRSTRRRIQKLITTYNVLKTDHFSERSEIHRSDKVVLGTSLPTLRAETFESVHWSTVEALIQKVEELRAAIERQYQFVDAELVRRYGRASDAAPRYPHIDVQLVDKRRNRSVPLPMVP